MAKDPVCGMEVDETQPAGEMDWKGNTYFFCAPACKQQFENDPEKYISGDAPSENLPRQ